MVFGLLAEFFLGEFQSRFQMASLDHFDQLLLFKTKEEVGVFV